jgi:hypothetical protein
MGRVRSATDDPIGALRLQQQEEMGGARQKLKNLQKEREDMRQFVTEGKEAYNVRKADADAAIAAQKTLVEQGIPQAQRAELELARQKRGAQLGGIVSERRGSILGTREMAAEIAGRPREALELNLARQQEEMEQRFKGEMAGQWIVGKDGKRTPTETGKLILERQSAQREQQTVAYQKQIQQWIENPPMAMQTTGREAQGSDKQEQRRTRTYGLTDGSHNRRKPTQQRRAAH